MKNGASFNFNANGSFQYQHDGGPSTHDSFSYKINDGKNDSLNLATVTITINQLNDSPVANPDVYVVSLGGTLRTDAGSGLLANDFDEEGDALSVLPGDVGVRQGILELADDGSFNYTHSDSDTSGDSFQYMVETKQGILVGPTTVSILISDLEDILRTASDSANTDEDTPVTIDVLSNDPELGMQCRQDRFPNALKETPTPPPTRTATPPATPTPPTAPTPTPVAQDVVQASNLVWSFLGACLVVDRSQLEAERVKGNWFVQVVQGTLPEYGLWKVDSITGRVEPQDPLARGLEDFVGSGCDAALLPLPFRPTPVPTPTLVPSPTPTVPSPAVQTATQAFDVTASFLGSCFPVGAMSAYSFKALGNWFVPVTLDSDEPLGLWKVSTFDGVLEPQDVLARELESYVNSACDSDLLPDLLLPTPTSVPIPTVTATPQPTPTSLPRITTASQAETAVWAHLVVCFQDLPLDDFEATLDPASGNWVVRSIEDAARNNGIWTVDAITGVVSPANSQASLREGQIQRGGC